MKDKKNIQVVVRVGRVWKDGGRGAGVAGLGRVGGTASECLESRQEGEKEQTNK